MYVVRQFVIYSLIDQSFPESWWLCDIEIGEIKMPLLFSDGGVFLQK